MKSPVLSYSRKCNVLDGSPEPSHQSRNSRLKNSMDWRPSQQILHKEQKSTPARFLPLTENDPMLSPSYLSSPLETILESLDDYDSQYIPLHDIIEAYSVFSFRVRSQSHAILRARQPLPALTLFRDHAASIARALKRDVRRVLVEPLHQLHQHQQPPSFLEAISTELSMNEHDIQHAQDLSTLSQYSLRVLSDVFAFESLYSCFSVHDIQDLLTDLLRIALTATLPTPNADRTWSLVFWTIQAQKLPRNILSVKKVDIVTALRQALNGGRGFQAKLDGLKAVHMLLQREPELLGSTVSSFLPAVLTNLVTEDVDCRRQAANALCGITLAKLNMLTADFPHETISQNIHAFLKAHTSMPEHSQVASCLPHFISQAFASHSGRELFWAAVVPACMIVLSDHFLFLRHSLKFCVNSFKPALNHGNKNVRALHSPVWKTLIWAFSRLPVDQTWLRPEDPDLPPKMIGLRGRAFRLLRQEVGSGKGVSLVEALLLPHPDRGTTTMGSVSRVLLVIESMVAKPEQSDQQDGVLLLHRLASAVGNPTTQSDRPQEHSDHISQISSLFDGTLLDTAAPEAVAEAVRALGRVDLGDIRQLSEVEIVQNWDQFVDVWISAMEMSLQATQLRLSSELLDIWQTLLLVKTDLTQGNEHLTSPSSFAGRVASIVSRFLVGSNATASVQARRLIIVKKLWAVMKNVYSHSWLPAEIILAAVLKLEFNLNEDIVRAAWSQLCADLIAIGIPTLLHVLFNRSERQEGQGVTRQLWTVLARAWQDPDGKAGWDQLASFLVIPFKAWVMSDDELELWASTLHSAVLLARSNSIQATAVIDRILQRMGPNELEVLVSFPKGVYLILANLGLAESQDIPSKVLDIVDRTLTSNYPPRPESLAACLEILRFISQIFSILPVALLAQLLLILKGSISLWIGDAKSVMLSTEHELVVQTLYCRTLNQLREAPSSIATLNVIAPFLCSAFGRQTPSAIGPAAFDEYWRATYHGIKEYKPLYPDCLKACLLGYGDAYGGSIANGLSISSGSQDTRKSTVPDSQPSYHGPNDANFLLQELASLSLLSEQHMTSNPGSLDTVTPRSSPPHQNQSSQDTTRQPQANNVPVVDGPIDKDSPIHKRPSPVPIDNADRKRRKTLSDLNAIQPFSEQVTAQGSRAPKQSPNFDSVRSPSASSQFVSQSTDGRKRKRVVDWLNVSRNATHLDRQEVDAPDGRTPPQSPSVWMPSDDDYNSWEGGMHPDHVQEDSENVLAPDSDLGDLGETRRDGHDFVSSPPQMARHNKQREQWRRAQSAPNVLPSKQSHRDESPLLPGDSTRIRALERAYTVLADHASQIPVVDLVRATGLVTKLQSVLTEQLAKKFASEPADSR